MAADSSKAQNKKQPGPSRANVNYACIAELIKKEERWQKVRSFLYGTQEQTQPPVKPYGIQQQQKAAELLASTYLMREGRPNFDIRASRSIWASSNPGYVFRDGKTLRSVAKSDYSWNEEEIAYNRANCGPYKQYNRKRDQHTRYNEAVVVFRQAMKSTSPAAAGATSPQGRGTS